ncbi:MAG: transcriptional regulator [Bacteroidales bacterium]
MFKELNPLLHSELRLAIISLLIAVDSADFSYLREKTAASAGNLSVQIEKLRIAGYITVQKGYRGKIPQTTCKITAEGILALEAYIEALKTYITL